MCMGGCGGGNKTPRKAPVMNTSKPKGKTVTLGAVRPKTSFGTPKVRSSVFRSGR